MTEKVHDSHYGLILKLKGQILYLIVNFNFFNDALQEMHFEF